MSIALKTILCIIVTLIQIFSVLIINYLEHGKNINKLCWFLCVLICPIISIVVYSLFIIIPRLANGIKYSKKLADDKIFENLIEDKSILSIQTRNDTYYNKFVNHYSFADNRIILLNNQNMFLESLVSNITNAKQSIYIKCEAFSTDVIGQKVRDLLIKKSIDGTEVKVLYSKSDARFKSIKNMRLMTNAGIIVQKNKYFGMKSKQNIMIFDNSRAIFGSSSIYDKELSSSDANVYLEGSIVSHMALEFLKEFNYVTRKYFPFNNKVSKSGSQNIDYFETSYDNQHYDKGLNALLLTARESIVIQTNKFLPNESTMDILRLKAKEGVLIKLLVTENKSYKPTCLASRGALKILSRSGCDVYEYQGKMSSKVLIIDGQTVLLGNCNLSKYEYNSVQHSEILIRDKEFSNHLLKKIKTDALNCTSLQGGDLTFLEKFFNRLF